MAGRGRAPWAAGAGADGNAFGKLDKMVWGGSGVHTLRYDDAGALLAYEDALGQVFRWERDAEGRLLAEIDPLGNRTHYEHDAAGFVSTMIDALGGAARYERDARGDMTAVHDDAGFVVGFAYDSRGLLVGATSRCRRARCRSRSGTARWGRSGTSSTG
ncbi:hypothetical protein ACMHYB_19145 [Sorangium sp. So ce1128]